MNDPNDPRARLMAETFQENWESGPTRDFARRAASVARTRRRLRHGLAYGAIGALLVATGYLSIPTQNVAPTHVTSAPLETSAPQKTRYEIISDEEFIALMGPRPVLILPQENGTKQIVLVAR
jgi:hypothetical protein